MTKIRIGQHLTMPMRLHTWAMMYIVLYDMN